jgi:proton-translocating NADH-quinone oxidoreductase chain N
MVWQYDPAQTMTYTYGMILLEMTGLSLTISALTLFLASLAIVFSFREIETHPEADKYYVMLLVLTGMTIGLVCAADLFNMWVWFEGTAISSYLLVAFYKNHDHALAAAMKYFVQTAVGSVLVLFGIALVLLQNHTLGFARLTVSPSPLLVIAGALFVMGFGVKAALFPNYTWLPDAYTESPTAVSAFLSGIVTVTAIIALLKALSVVLWSASQWGILLIVIALLNITIANLLAIRQTEVKRVLAYSSIGHIGYILLAAGIGIASHSMLGMRASILHLFIHGLMKSLGFFVIGAFAYVLRRDNSKPLHIKDLNGVFKRYPGMTLALIVSLLSLAGIPLTAGFISKWQIFFAGTLSQSGWIMLFTIIAALNSVLSLVYYLSVINGINSESQETHWQNTSNIPLSMRLPIILLTISVVILGIFPNLIDWLINPASEVLFSYLGG